MSQPTARPWTGTAGTRATAAAAATVAAAVFTVPAVNAVLSAADHHADALPVPAAVSDVSPVIHHTIPVALATALSPSLSPSLSASLASALSPSLPAALPTSPEVPMPRQSPEAVGALGVAGAAGWNGTAREVAAWAAKPGASRPVDMAVREADASESVRRFLASPVAGGVQPQPHTIAELLTPPIPAATPAAPAATGGTAVAGASVAPSAGSVAPSSAAGGAQTAGLVMPPVPSKGGAALKAAMGAMGTPYRWGGTGRGGFDCSGLAQWAYRKAGITLPRSSRSQSGVGTPVSRNDLRPGDLVFFYRPVSHVGIYVGNGNVVHAPQTGDVVKISPISRMPFAGARRL